MNNFKKIRIEEAIRLLMMLNRIEASAVNQTTGSNLTVGNGYYIYIEICNICPHICHVFNADQELTVGRNEEQNAICIQDERVSRRHGSFWVQQGYLYLRNVSEGNFIMLRRRGRRIPVYPGDMKEIMHGDRISFGTAVMKAYLLYGTSLVMN